MRQSESPKNFEPKKWPQSFFFICSELHPKSFCPSQVPFASFFRRDKALWSLYFHDDFANRKSPPMKHPPPTPTRRRPQKRFESEERTPPSDAHEKQKSPGS